MIKVCACGGCVLWPLPRRYPMDTRQFLTCLMTVHTVITAPDCTFRVCWYRRGRARCSKRPTTCSLALVRSYAPGTQGARRDDDRSFVERIMVATRRSSANATAEVKPQELVRAPFRHSLP